IRSGTFLLICAIGSYRRLQKSLRALSARDSSHFEPDSVSCHISPHRGRVSILKVPLESPRQRAHARVYHIM
ncbi:hypothetical protein BDV93DRAFT_530031, partial [Ceratobasidium sp. AG-I]